MEKNNFYGSKEFVPVDSLIIPEYYRKDDIDDRVNVIRNGIEKFGVKSPIIVNESEDRHNIIIHGVLIYELAKELNILEVPVHYLNLTIQEEKELSVLLNQKGKSQLNIGEIIELLGNASYDSFFGFQNQGSILEKHIQKTKNNADVKNTSPNKSIKQLIFRLSDTDKLLFDEICKELEVKNQTQALQILMEFYCKNK